MRCLFLAIRRLLFGAAIILSACGQLNSQDHQDGIGVLPADALPIRKAAVQETILYRAPDRSEVIGEYAVGDHLLWILNSAGKKTVWVDGNQNGGTYDDVRYVTYWPEAKRLAFVGKGRSRLVLVADGIEGSAEYKNMGEPALDPDGRLLVPAARQHKFRLLINGQESGEEYDDLWPPRFSPDGKHSLYFAQRHGKEFAVLDGQRVGPELNEIGLPWHNLNNIHLHSEVDDARFSSADPVYSGNPPLEYQCARLQPGPRSEYVSAAQPIWTADSRHSVFQGFVRGGRLAMFVDGVPGPPFDAMGEIGFSQDGQHMAYAGATLNVGMLGDQTTALVQDGKISDVFKLRQFVPPRSTTLIRTESFCNDYFAISDPQYASDGSLIYARQTDNDVVVRFKGVDGPNLVAIRSAIALSADRNHIRYTGLMRTGEGLQLVEVYDNAVTATLANVPSQTGWRTSFTMIDRNATSFGYDVLVDAGFRFYRGETARAHRRFVVNSKPGPTYNANGMWGQFSDEGKHYFYVVEGAQKQQDLVVFDGCESPLYDSILEESIRFKGDTSLEFVARQGRQFLRVVMQSN